MNKGVVEQVGTSLEVYRNPATTFVAGFIGSPSMNFLTGRGKSAMIEPGATRQGSSVASPGPAIQTSIRPEHLRCCAPGTGLCDAEVAFFLMNLARKPWCTCVYILRLENATPPPALGTRVGLTAASRHRFFFDPQGRRLPCGEAPLLKG